MYFIIFVIASVAWQSSKFMPARMRGHIASTGSPRSLRSLAITIILKCVNKKNKSTVPSSPLWRGAAQRRGGQRIQERVPILSLRAIANGVTIQ